MASYKLTSVRYSTKKEKLRIQNGRSDVVLELNNGFLNFRQLLKVVAEQAGSSPGSRFVIRAEYINQLLSYYLETPTDGADDLVCSGSSWQRLDRCSCGWSEHETIYGSYHVNVADGASTNPIDDFISLNKEKDFAIEIELVKCLETVSNTILSKLSEIILRLSREKQENQKKYLIDFMGKSQTKVFIDKEWLYNYLYDLYYFLNQSSTHFLRPAISFYTKSKDDLHSVKASIVSGSKKRGVNTNIHYLFQDFPWKPSDNSNDLDGAAQSQLLSSISELSDAFFSSNNLFGCITNVNFVSALFAFPQTKIPGIRYIEEIDYGTINDFTGFSSEYFLGSLYHNFHTQLPITIHPDDLIKHTLVTGVTGSGKTTTIKSMLLVLYKNKKPFLILEPAKTEYKNLNIEGLKRYILGIETEDCLKLNPFEFPYKKEGTPGIHLQTHLDLLKSIFIAAFPMYGPMPYVLEKAFYHIYQWYGWDFKSGHNIYWDDDSVDKSALFPTLDDLYNAIDHIVSIQGYSKDLQNDLTAALKVRVGSLKSGAKGTMLNTKRGTDIGKLLSCPTVVELERIGDAQEKVFIMGLLLVSIYEHYIAVGTDSEEKLKHLLVIEEAHRLLENVQQSNNNEIADMKGKAIETFNNILSEIRAYGQGIVVADQIPTKISPDVIKNTNLKIIHRLFSLDDRNAVGDAIGLDHKQKKGLIHLNLGEAIVFHAGLPEAVKIIVDSRGKEKGRSVPMDQAKDLIILDVVISTTEIYSEIKRVFQTALVFDWSYTTIQEKLGDILSNYSIESDGELIDQLVSNLVEWFAIKLRNNKSIPNSFRNENKLKKLGTKPVDVIKGIRGFIEENRPTIQFSNTIKSTYVDALAYFIYAYAEDRKAVSKIIETIRSARREKFRYYNTETQSMIMAETDMDKYFCISDLSEDEITELCQCIVYFCSHPLNDFRGYFDTPNMPVSDEEYKKQLQTDEVITPETVSTASSLETAIKPLLESIAGNLKDIWQKQGIDPVIKNLIRLPLVLLLANTLLIILAVLIMIVR